MVARWMVFAGALLTTLPAMAQKPAAPPATQEAPPPPPAATREPPGRVVQGLMDRAVDAFSRSAWEEGLAELDDAEAIAPDTPEVWAMRGTALVQMRRLDEAQEAFDRADAIAPDLFDTLRGRGLLAGEQGRYAEAIDLLGRALAIRPDDNITRTYHIAALVSGGQGERALELADAIIAAEPDNFLAWPLRIMALHELGRDAEAAQAARDMVTTFPDNPMAQAAATSLLEESGQYEEADAMLAENLASGETPLILLQSATRRSPAENGIKLRELTRALELDPQFTPALYERANTYWADYRLREAMADIDRLIELEPQNWGAHQLRARILMDQNRNADAGRIAAQLVADHAEVPDALATAMFIYAELGQMTRARQTRDRLRAIAPDHFALDWSL